MNAYKGSNIPLKTLKWFLEHQGCKLIKTTGGHEKYSRPDLNRPITIQSHIDPVPQFIFKQVLKTLNFTVQQFHEYCKKYY